MKNLFGNTWVSDKRLSKKSSMVYHAYIEVNKPEVASPSATPLIILARTIEDAAKVVHKVFEGEEVLVESLNMVETVLVINRDKILKKADCVIEFEKGSLDIVAGVGFMPISPTCYRLLENATYAKKYDKPDELAQEESECAEDTPIN